MSVPDTHQPPARPGRGGAASIPEAVARRRADAARPAGDDRSPDPAPATSSQPQSSDGALARRVLSRLQEQAWNQGVSRERFVRQSPDAEVAAWDEARPRRRPAEADASMDRGPGLAPGRDRPGPTRFDPRPGRRELERAIVERGWAGKLAMAQVAVAWERIVGEQIAEHSQVVRFEEGRLDVQASSSAWAQQLRLMMPSIHAAILRELERVSPDQRARAVDIRVYGPSAPSWRHGRYGGARGGQGPRDTYG